MMNEAGNCKRFRNIYIPGVRVRAIYGMLILLILKLFLRTESQLKSQFNLDCLLSNRKT